MMYRQQLPQLTNDIFLTDGGLETTLIYLKGWELPSFASFDLLSVPAGKQQLIDYYQSYLEFACSKQLGFILESATWRANPDWASKLGYSVTELAEINREAIKILVNLRNQYQTTSSKVVISGCVGPRGDGYKPAARMSVEEARAYHAQQINTLADTQADLISAMTMNYVEEAIGVVLACKDANMPVAISFTTETDGRLPDGTDLRTAIENVDKATNNGPVYYMINCAHPDHFSSALSDSMVIDRIRAIRANASRLSHAELDESTTLDRGDTDEFGKLYRQLRKFFPQLTILGGCCGTDLQHIESIHHHCCS